jgi:hypothetical protein
MRTGIMHSDNFNSKNRQIVSQPAANPSASIEEETHAPSVPAALPTSPQANNPLEIIADAENNPCFYALIPY